MTAATARTAHEYRRLLTVIAIPLIDKLAAYAPDEASRTVCLQVRAVFDCDWRRVNEALTTDAKDIAP